MLNIRIYDEDFERVGFIGAARAFRLVRRLRGPGSFELELHPDSPYASALRRGRLLLADGNPGRCGLIERVARVSGEDGRETLTVSGPTPEGLLARRLCVPPALSEGYYEGWDRESGPAESVMKRYVERHCAAGAGPDRAFPGLSVAPDLGRGPELSWQARFETVAAVLEAVSLCAGPGWSVRFRPESGDFVFDIVEGRDLTAGQSNNPRAIFSAERGGLCELRYAEDGRRQATVGWAGGRGLNESRLILPVGGGSGYGRRETFLNCAGAQPEELEAEGLARLAARGPSRLLRARVVRKPGRIECLPGDRVTVVYALRGMRFDAVIAEIAEQRTPDGERLEYVFEE